MKRIGVKITMLKCNMKKMLVLALLSAGYAGVAHAGTPGDITNQKADVTFTNPSVVSLSISPVSGLVAGTHKKGLKVADVEATDNESALIAYRWDPTSGTVLKDKVQNTIRIPGKSTPGVLEVSIVPAIVGYEVKDGGNGWIVPSKKMTDEKLIVKTDSTAPILADTYTLSIDAAEWNA